MFQCVTCFRVLHVSMCYVFQCASFVTVTCFSALQVSLSYVFQCATFVTVTCFSALHVWYQGCCNNIDNFIADKPLQKYIAFHATSDDDGTLF